MANVAILAGNSQYRSLSELTCCHDDLIAVRELLDATEKYSYIEVIEDVDADGLKSGIRAAVDKESSIDELFFYFTGHGYQHEGEMYYRSASFDPKRPNETGLSINELHTLLRLFNAELVVKVIDACNSGTLLIKSDGGIVLQKEGFKQIIQISSSLDTQNSLTGDPLSLFTEKFCTAALRKLEGIVYYTDIIRALRDEFIDNHGQTPFFVSQVTGREQFVDDAKRLDALRTKMITITLPLPSEGQHTHPAVPSLRSLLEKAERNIANADQVASFVATFFEGLMAKISVGGYANGEFASLFDLEAVEHPDFMEPTARDFIIQILSKENRLDNFVTATISQKRKRNPWPYTAAGGLLPMWPDETEPEIYTLTLNCSMQKAQIRVTLSPKYHSLRRLNLVVTCAPSLEYCYIFEIGTQHRLKDFGSFDTEGGEVVRRWYKLRWTDSPDGVAEKIASRLAEIVRETLEAVTQKLSSDKS